MTQSVQEQIRILPAIEAELHLIQIGGEMLRADLVPCSHNATLQEAESILDGICMDIASNVNPVLVTNRLVFILGDSRIVHRPRVGDQFVSDNHIDIFADIFADVLRQRSMLNIFGMEKSQIAITLAQSNYNLFCRSTSTHSCAVGFSADIGFIHFNRAIKRGLIYFLHSSTDAMAEIPCCLVAHSQGALDLIRGHTLA